jgi:hypothetical protein
VRSIVLNAVRVQGALARTTIAQHTGLSLPTVAGIMAELYRGSHSGAGEFGHVTMVPDGPLCACGKRGCLRRA